MEKIEIKIKLMDTYGNIFKFGTISSGAISAFILTNQSFLNQDMINRFFILLVCESIPLSITLVSLHRFSILEKDLSKDVISSYGNIINKNTIKIISIIVFIIVCLVYFIK